MVAFPTQLTDSDLDLEVIPTGLLTFAAQTLGNAATDSDGHAEDFAAALEAFAFGSAQVAELEPLLSEHFAGAIDVTSDTLAGETVQLAQNLENGDAILRDFSGLFSTGGTQAAAVAAVAAAVKGGAVNRKL